MKSALVFGAGFEGLACAHYLRKTHGLDVTVVDAAPHIGGVMRGFSAGDFHYDFGCQVFDNFDARVSDTIIDLAQDKCEFDDVSYGSRFAGKVTREVSVPDLTALDPACIATIQSEVQAADSDGLDANTLAEYYQRRWGKTAADVLDRINIKCLDDSATNLDQSSRIYAGLTRLRIFDDDDFALSLKNKDPLIDAKVAVPRAAGSFYETSQKKVPSQNIIPVPSSFGGFCTSAAEVLERNDVTLQLGTKLTALAIDNGKVTATAKSETETPVAFCADFAVWCASFELLCALLGVENKTPDFLSPIGTTITYYVAPATAIDPLGYIQNYDTDMRFFRWSSMGLYTRQINASGHSFCCTETPSETSQDISDPQEEALRDWQDLGRLNLVSGTPVAPPMRRFVPGVIKRRRPGYSTAASTAMTKLDLHVAETMVYQKPDAFGRTPTARNLFNEIDAVMS